MKLSCQLQVSGAWLLLQLLLGAPSALALGNGSAAFRSVRVCPPASEPTNVTGLVNVAACAIECAARPTCVAASHSPAEAACRLATVGQFAQSWRSSAAATSGCRSDVNVQRLMAGGGVASVLATSTRLSLLAFYNFLLGTSNLADAANASFAASLGSGARLTDAGVWLDGGSGSFVRLDTEAGNLTKFLGYGSQFTYFAKFQRAWQPGQTRMNIQEFMRSNSSADSGGNWHEFRSSADANFTSLSIESQFESVKVKSSSQVLNLLPVGDSVPVFAAAAFNGTAFNKFYWNGTFYSGTVSTYSSNFTANWNDKLRLGRYSSSNTDWNMRGLFICWGVATGILNAAQLEEINALC